MSIEDLAREGGLDASYLSGIERGLRRPALEKIEGVTGAFGMTLSELVKLAEEERKRNRDDRQGRTES